VSDLGICHGDKGQGRLPYVLLNGVHVRGGVSVSCVWRWLTTSVDGGEGLIVQAGILNLEERGRFPDESGKNERHTSSQWSHSVVPTTVGITWGKIVIQYWWFTCCCCLFVGEYQRRDPRAKNVTLKLWVQNLLYYESIKRDPKTRPINECRCDERLKTKSEESTGLTYIGLFG
jgi:hypothetical protein